jgi:hypothetical protein
MDATFGFYSCKPETHSDLSGNGRKNVSTHITVPKIGVGGYRYLHIGNKKMHSFVFFTQRPFHKSRKQRYLIKFQQKFSGSLNPILQGNFGIHGFIFFKFVDFDILECQISE